MGQAASSWSSRETSDSVMLAPAIELEGMVGDGAEQVDASDNTVVMLAPATEQADVSANNTSTLNNRSRKNRSKVWDYFHIIPSANREPAKAKCIRCGRELTWGHGTSALHKHLKSCNKKRPATEDTLNHPSASDSVQNGAIMSTNDSEGSKRMRIEYNVATTTHLGGKAGFLKRIQEIVLELRSNRGDVIEYLKDSIARSDHCQIGNSYARVRASSSLPGKIYGRDVEKNKIIRAIETAKSDNITVLPIVGIIGVGKTALAKLVYHDQRVEREFERIWVWVSNVFDEVRVTREILDVVTLASHKGSHKRESYQGVSNYSTLLEALKKHMACLSKKFLLVLDDVCDYMDISHWKDLIDALGSSCIKGNVIIVTVRNLFVAKRLGTIEPVKLRALGNDDFWLLFKACAFGDNNCKEHLGIGRQIAAKLNGNPLAAESAADMLREQPTLRHWKSILKNGVWESLQFHGGIMTALKISYYQLPYSLQQCLLFCSIFPNGYLFHIVDLVYMWISSGFVKSVEVGQDYLNALVNSGFFEDVETSILHHKKCYAMCGIMHEFARLVSRSEFGTMDGLECKEVLPTVRHFSVLIDSVYHKDILHNGKLEEKLKSIISLVRRLRTLVLIDHVHPYSHHTYARIPPPQMASTTKLRMDACRKDKMDDGIAVINIAEITGHTKLEETRPTSSGNECIHAHKGVNYQPRSREQSINKQQMEHIVQFMNNNHLVFQNDIGRKFMSLEQKLDAKLLAHGEAIEEKRMGSPVRFEELRQLLQENQQSMSKDAYIQEPWTVHPENCRANFQQDQFYVKGKEPPEAPTIQDTIMAENKVPRDSSTYQIAPHEPSLDMDYTVEDKEVFYFITYSYLEAEVVEIDDHVLTIQQLRPNVTDGFIYDQVINAYADISSVETDSRSFISTFQARKLLGETGGINSAKQTTSWVRVIADKCIGRDLVFVPMNVNGNHWVLLVLNFLKEEVQILNSLASNPNTRDIVKEHTLVANIQECIDSAIAAGNVPVPQPINITQWETKMYSKIPQQTNGHSCGAFILKYMMAWDGDKMIEYFTQSHIDIFKRKICSALLLSDCNKRRLGSYKDLITKQAYDAKRAEVLREDASKSNDDDVKEISNLMDASKSNNSTKRKHGHPKKNDKTPKSVKDHLSIASITNRVQRPNHWVSDPGLFQFI